MSSGPGVRIALRLIADGTIGTARFRVVQFDDARDVAERLCELLEGATIDEAARTSARALARLTGRGEDDPVPRQVAFALGAALTPFLGRRARYGSAMVCTCFSIEETVIRELTEQHRCSSVEELQEHVPVCMGCGTCRPDVQKLIAEVRAKTDG